MTGDDKKPAAKKGKTGGRKGKKSEVKVEVESDGGKFIHDLLEWDCYADVFCR